MNNIVETVGSLSFASRLALRLLGSRIVCMCMLLVLLLVVVLRIEPGLGALVLLLYLLYLLLVVLGVVLLFPIWFWTYSSVPVAARGL